MNACMFKSKFLEYVLIKFYGFKFNHKYNNSEYERHQRHTRIYSPKRLLK